MLNIVQIIERQEFALLPSSDSEPVIKKLGVFGDAPTFLSPDSSVVMISNHINIQQMRKGKPLLCFTYFIQCLE